MANAWILRPLPATISATTGALQLGAPENTLLDYAGVVYQVACSAAGNICRTVYDLGAVTPVDTVMVFGVGVLPLDGTVTVTFLDAGGGSLGSVSSSAYAGGATSPAGLGVSILSAAAPVNARSVRLQYTATASGQAVRFARVVIGRRFVPERNFSYGASVGLRDLGSLDLSPRGVMLRRRGAKLRTVALTFPSIRKDEMEATTRPLLEYLGNTEMVALLTDPALDAQIASRAYFGPLVGDLAHVWRNAVAYEAKLNLVSIFN